MMMMMMILIMVVMRMKVITIIRDGDEKEDINDRCGAYDNKDVDVDNREK